ncbi:MAG: PEGA domain-containing protein [Polyangia bacterium]
MDGERKILRTGTRLVAGWLALALAFCGSTAAAQDRDVEEARKQFDIGLDLLEEERWDQAATAFRTAYALEPNYRVLFNIAEAESRADNYARALEAYTLYLAEGSDEIPKSRREHVREEIDRLNLLVGMIQVKCPVEGAVVMIDGRRHGRTPQLGPALVDLGEHEVVVKKEGAELHREKLRVGGGRLAWVIVETREGAPYAGAAGRLPDSGAEPVGKEDDAEGPPPPPGKTEHGGREEAARGEGAEEGDAGPEDAGRYSTWAWVAFGAGGAAALAAVVTGSLALDGWSRVEDACDGRVCPDGRRDDRDRVRALAVSTDVLIGVAAAGAAAGVTLLLLPETEESRSSLELLPAVGSRGLGLSMEGTF